MLPVIDILGQKIFSYPLILGVIWGITYHNLKNTKDSKRIPHFNIFFLIVFLFSWIGAKTLFVLTQNNYETNSLISNSNFWLGGGLVFYGGLIFGVASLVSYFKFFKIPLRHASFILPHLVLGHAIGRVGCFMAGCCYGTPTESKLGVYMHSEYRHAVQLYEAVLLLLLAWILFRRLAAKKSIIWFYFMGYALIRFGTEFYRGDIIRGEVILNLSTSQFISLIIAISTFCLILAQRKINRPF